LARIAIRSTAGCRPWMKEHGVRFQPSLGGTLHLSRTNAFFLGGGKALVNAYFHAAQSMGVEVVYDSEAVDLRFSDSRFISALVKRDGKEEEIKARTLVAASGGFESNLEWLRE